jgi:hypothetical protein
MSDFDILGLLLGFAVLGAGVLAIIKFISRRMHHEASPYGPPPGGDDSSAGAGGSA